MLQLISFILIALILFLLYYISTRKFTYWRIRNLPFVKPLPFFGNYLDYILLKESPTVITDEICKRYPGEPLIGAFYGTEPSLIVKGLEMVKLVTTKNFYYFSSREIGDYTHREPATQNLFFTQGDKWRVIRQNLTPLFTAAKMKNMFYLIEKCASSFEDMLEEETVQSPVVEVQPLMARYTMDCIGSCAFGVETNTMKTTNYINPFKIMGDKIFETSINRGMRLVFRAMWPRVFYGLGFTTFPYEIIQFFNSLLINVFKERQYKPTQRNDFVDLMLNFKQNQVLIGDSISNLKTNEDKKVHVKIDDELLTAQCVVFFAAGYETSANTLNLTLYELAKNKEAQRRITDEIDEYLQRHDGKMGFECVKELPYVEAVLDETLRMYPVLGVITRELVEDYTLPTGLRLDRGMRIHIPVYHLHHNPDYFPEPEKFIPERFIGKQKEMIKPYSYMPFGEGPRICIGMRFAKMQMVAGLIAIFKKYQVETTNRTPNGVKFDPTAIVTTPRDPIILKLIRRPDNNNRQKNGFSHTSKQD